MDFQSGSSGMVTGLLCDEKGNSETKKTLVVIS